MIGITLKQLWYFEALARFGHFGRAAQACSITQPALSQQMKELEAIIGAPLIERGTRQMRLTSLGEDFLLRARAILVQVDELSDLARASQGALTGTLKLGIIPTVAPYWLPHVMGALNAQFPKLQLDLRESITQSLISNLLAGSLDVAIVALPISEPALHEFPLFEEDFVLVRPEADAHKPAPSPSMLQDMRLLLLEEGHCFRDQALSFCDIGQTQPRQVMEGSSLSTLVQMVGAGLGVTLLPEMAMALESRASDVAIARFAEPAPARTIGMVWRKATPLSDQLTELGALLREAVPG